MTLAPPTRPASFVKQQKMFTRWVVVLEIPILCPEAINEMICFRKKGWFTSSIKSFRHFFRTHFEEFRLCLFLGPSKMTYVYNGIRI